MSFPAAGIGKQHDAAASGDAGAFGRLAEPHRRELQLHCYRMLGSLHEAEDLVQETFLRAWRGIDRFEGRSSFRSWLYKIATNACLTALAGRAGIGRTLPEERGDPNDPWPEQHETEMLWLEPYPDRALEGVFDNAEAGEARFEQRESVRLAFVAAIQHLPPRQRAALLLRDVLGFSAREAADLIDSSVASANSVLQRARDTLAIRLPDVGKAPPLDPRDDALVARYVASWESADLDAFVALLRDDAVLSMPPMREWYRGRDAIRGFVARAWAASRTGQPFRLLPAGANFQPAFGLYKTAHGGSVLKAHSIQVLTLEEGRIAAVNGFVDARLFSRFGLPEALTLAG
jgi:RNA polymerase sigma-70 factor (ECF subfamily)